MQNLTLSKQELISLLQTLSRELEVHIREQVCLKASMIDEKFWETLTYATDDYSSKVKAHLEKIVFTAQRIEEIAAYLAKQPT